MAMGKRRGGKAGRPGPPAGPAPAAPAGRRARWLWPLTLGVGALAVAGLAFGVWRLVGTGPSPAEAPGPAFVGRQACAGCHPRETAAWRGSHHDLAMQEAAPESVLGDFGGATATRFGVTSTFSRRDGKYLVRTEGPDGQSREYEVAYTFGVVPLQQYLIRFPGGRLQALGWAWDSRPRAEGGQRWMHLYPAERIRPDDELHWTRPAQNWNHMCAECHSTDLRKGYVAVEDRYDTAWAELDVSCEACHGPGSRHVAWAEKQRRGGAREADRGLLVSMDRRAARAWAMDPQTGLARWSGTAPPGRGEVEACGRCHARRAPIVDPYVHGRPLADTHRISLLEEGLYHADGQIQDEVYEYGSFLQSKMYARGVTCSDCHDPHGLRLRAPGDAVCATCHLPARFDAPAHHHHKPGSAGASCVACHMPAKVYMVVDARRDHSFRVPRPDLSARLGTPDACTGCHRDRRPRWAAEVVAGWPGASRRDARHHGEALDLGRRGAPGALRALADLARDPGAPGIARATAFQLLGRRPGPAPEAAIEAGLRDADPLVRAAAVGALENAPPEVARSLAFRLLGDPVRSVRTEAARVLAGVPAGRLTPDERERLERGIEEYRQAQLVNGDRAWAYLNVALLEARRGAMEAAESALQSALRLDRRFVPAYVNLADLMRARGRDDEGERVLRGGLAVVPDQPDLLHALGLLHARQRRLDEALRALGRAAELRPESARFAYVHAIALASTGRPERALPLLEAAHRRHPDDVEILLALVTINRDRGALPAAREWARRLAPFADERPDVQRLLGELGIPAPG
jgi:tetratricopeptide (TPR) repeat protein